jgi:hypothetical protein
MAGLPWFKIYSNIVGHPKTRALEEATGNPDALAYIVRLLSWFNEYAPGGRADGARTARAAERHCEWRGADGELIAALESSGWIERDGSEIVLHDWDEVQGGHIAKAKKDAERKKIKRLQSRAAPDGARTALKRRADGAETARAEVADGARTARVEESRREEKRVEEITSSVSGATESLELRLVETTTPKPEDLQALWNRLAIAKKLGRWVKLTDDQRRLARLALKTCPDLPTWEAWLTAELQNPWNLGENPSRWKADVEWFLRVKTRNKVANFDPAALPSRPQGAQHGDYGPRGSVDRTGFTAEDIHGGGT